MLYRVNMSSHYSECKCNRKYTFMDTQEIPSILHVEMNDLAMHIECID